MEVSEACVGVGGVEGLWLVQGSALGKRVEVRLSGSWLLVAEVFVVSRTMEVSRTGPTSVLLVR